MGSTDMRTVNNDQLLVTDLSGIFFLNLFLLIFILSMRIPECKRRFHMRVGKHSWMKTSRNVGISPQDCEGSKPSVEPSADTDTVVQLRRALADASRLAEALAVEERDPSGVNAVRNFLV